MNAIHSQVANTVSWHPSPEVQSRIRRAADEFQMRPTAAVEALNLIQDPECSIRELVAVAQRDIKLTTDILKIANSALFGARSKIASLDQAVMRLGLPRCKNIILACVVSSMLKKPSAQHERLAELVWSHSLLTATIATHLNVDLGIGLMGEEYAAGLIHDLGRLLLGLADHERASAADPLDFDESMDVIEREQQILGTSHNIVGAWFAEDMRFPQSFVTCIRCHHSPGSANDSLCLTALIAAADDIANFCHRTGGWEGYHAEDNAAIVLLEEHGVFDAQTKLKYSFEKIMEKAFRDAKENR